MKKTLIAATTALAVAVGATGVTPAHAASGSSNPAADAMVPDSYTPPEDHGSSGTGSSPLDITLITGGVILGLSALLFLYEQVQTGKLVIPGLENIQLPDISPLTAGSSELSSGSGSSELSSNLSSEEDGSLAGLRAALSSQQ